MSRTAPAARRPVAGPLLAALAGAVAAATPGAAHAQVVFDPEARGTRGPHLTGAGRAGDGDATGVQLNPAQLGFLSSGSLALPVNLWREGAALPGRGGGLLLAAPVVWSSALGLGLSYVAPTAPLGVEGHTVMQLAYALRLGRKAAFGASWAHVWGSRYAGTDTFDLGLSYRPGRAVALAVVVEDVGQPDAAGGARLPRLWAAELAVRPTGTDRAELALGAAHADGDPWRWVVPRARLAARVTDGLRVYAQAETLPRAGQYAFASGADYRLAAGLSLDLDPHLGLAAAARAALPGSGGSELGAAAMVRVDGDRRPALLAPPVVARVSLDGVGGEREYLQLVRRVRALAADRGVIGVLLKVENVEVGMARIEELRDLVAMLRARGKRVVAYAPSPSTREYYLASACDAVVVHPAGVLSLTGLSQTVTFYKAAMDRLGVNVDLVRIGEFKGAMEPFIMTEQSPPVRDNKNALLDDVFGRLVAAIAQARGRGLDAARVRQLVDRGLFTPAEAQMAGLIDATKDESELEAYLRQALGQPRLALRDPDSAPPHREAWPTRRVAVVLVDGSIVDGPSQQLPLDMGTFAGSDTLVAALEECRQDWTVGAVVLRVNSPGGSAFASDVVARAISGLRKAGKPVVVSMGDVAASGGYYIAAPADLILAEPSTITGSIGIFGYKVDVRKLLGAVGIATETYRRGQHADYVSPYRPWTDEEIKLAAEKIRHFYGQFLETVAQGRRARGLTLVRVDEVGRGHVWTGAQALGLGLVDELGGLSVAIDHAARLGRVPLARDGQPDVAVLPPPRAGALERLLGVVAQSAEPPDAPGQLSAEAVLGAGLLRAGGRAAARLLAPLLVGGASGYQARLPYDIDIR